MLGDFEWDSYVGILVHVFARGGKVGKVEESKRAEFRVQSAE